MVRLDLNCEWTPPLPPLPPNLKITHLRRFPEKITHLSSDRVLYCFWSFSPLVMPKTTIFFACGGRFPLSNTQILPKIFRLRRAFPFGNAQTTPKLSSAAGVPTNMPAPSALENLITVAGCFSLFGNHFRSPKFIGRNVGGNKEKYSNGSLKWHVPLKWDRYKNPQTCHLSEPTTVKSLYKMVWMFEKLGTCHLSEPAT